MKLADVGMLVLLAAIWGAAFLFIRVAAPLLGPVVLVDIRVLLAGFVLLIGAVVTGRFSLPGSRWRQYLLLGPINAGIPFTLISVAELHITASFAAILNATTPLFAAVIAAAWSKTPLTAARLVGLLMGLVGVGVLVGWSPLPLSPVVLLSAGASLLAAAFYGVGGVYASRAFVGESPLTLSIWQQLAAGAVLIPFAVPGLPHATFTPGALIALLALALLATAAGYLLYFRLMANIGPTNTLSVTYLVPVFGLFWGGLFLHERVTVGTFVGLAIILASVTLVTGLRLQMPSTRLAAARRS